MIEKLPVWLDEVLKQEIPSEVAAFCFNLYEDGDDTWSMEVVGTKRFDAGDEDWGCDELTDFGTRANPFSWQKAGKWDEVQEEVISCLKTYLEQGTYASVLKEKSGVGAGFVDGDIEVVYMKSVAGRRVNCDADSTVPPVS